MSWLSELFSSSVGTVVEKAGEAIDRLVTSDEEKLKLKNELVLIETQAKLTAQKQADESEIRLEEEITERWQSDNSADDKLAKRVRPASLIYLLLSMSFFVFVDSTGYFDFEVKDAYISLYETLLLLVFAAYFGGRSLEKIMVRRKDSL